MTMKYLGRLFLAVTAVKTVFADSPAAPSPLADTDLICTTDNSVDCYPRVFQPTEKFQLIRDGQDLPPGLHVRLNIYTGEKEARLNIPMEDDVESQLEGLPIEQSVVVVDQPEDITAIGRQAMRDQVPQRPPADESAGKIVPPQDVEGGDSEIFIRAIDVLDGQHVDDGAITSALSDLTELSHDIYYGVEIAKRGRTLQHLVNLMSSDSASQRRQAASIIGGSVQNNPTALKEALAAWELIMQTCNKGSKTRPGCEGETLIKRLHDCLEKESDPAVMKAKVYALVGLIKDSTVRDDFLANRGMELLLAIFTKHGVQWDNTRIKIAQFVTDTFLDEQMGAELGIWPTKQISALVGNSHCAEPKFAQADTCWEYHLEQQVEDQDLEGRNWRLQFLKLLREARRSAEDSEGMVSEDETKVKDEL
jgi:nucleotide exchange factor SIL1